MRLWSVHPEYLDTKGLVALWREALLAQKVLLGETKGYKNHPQLNRFKEQAMPLVAMSLYLQYVWEEANSRGYSFQKEKIYHKSVKKKIKLSVTNQQIKYEFQHLSKKIEIRDPQLYRKIILVKRIKPHPLFSIKVGEIESWEKL